MCIFKDIFFFSCVLLPNSVVCTRRFVQGAAQYLPRVVCPYALSNLCQHIASIVAEHYTGNILQKGNQFNTKVDYFQALTEIGENVGPTTLGRDWAVPCLILIINTITKYRKRSIQSQTTESIFLQRTQEQKPATSIVVSVAYSLWSNLFNTLQHYF